VYSNLGFSGIKTFLFPPKDVNGDAIDVDVDETCTPLLTLELNEDVETTTTTASPPTTAVAPAPPAKNEPFAFMTTPWTRAGIAATIGASTANWFSDVQVGSKVLAHELQDVMEKLLPFSDN
jgi:hypothetical protein